MGVISPKLTPTVRPPHLISSIRCDLKGDFIPSCSQTRLQLSGNTGASSTVAIRMISAEV